MYGFLAIRSIRVDCWISKLFTRQTLELPTDRPTNRKSAKKTVRFSEKLKWAFWEAGFGFLCGAAWFRWSRDRRFQQFSDKRRTITYFGDPSGKTCRRPAPGYAHGQVRTHGQTLLFYRYRCSVHWRPSLGMPACRRSGTSVMSRRYLDIQNFFGNWRKSLNFGVFATLNLKFFWGSSP